MDQIDRDCIAAKALGLSYGYYKALSHDSTMQHTPIACNRRQRRQQPRKFSDTEAFALWQQGRSDGQIAAEVGVTKACIQAWRSRLELPPYTSTGVDRQKYRLDLFPDGTPVVLIQNDEL